MGVALHVPAGRHYREDRQAICRGFDFRRRARNGQARADRAAAGQELRAYLYSQTDVKPECSYRSGKRGLRHMAKAKKKDQEETAAQEDILTVETVEEIVVEEALQ